MKGPERPGSQTTTERTRLRACVPGVLGVSGVFQAGLLPLFQSGLLSDKGVLSRRDYVKDRGRESASSPSLRTGQARFAHPALQLMGSNSETEVFE